MNRPFSVLVFSLLALSLAACGGDVRSDVMAAAEAEPIATEQTLPLATVESAEVKRDVPYVPTPQPTVDEMLRMAKVTRNDVLYDLGSGDGRIVITAAREHGARGIGIDIDPQRITEANVNAKEARVTDRVQFIQGDLFEADLREATAVTLYLLRSVNLRLRPKLLEELRPGTPVVSHDFDMGEWEPDDQKRVGGDQLYLWIIPARIDGSWRWNASDGSPRVAQFSQEFQRFNGRAEGSGAMDVRNGRLNGADISFELVRDGNVERYKGKVSGNTIQGTMESGGRRASWRAQRG